jgi:hypothetical protein
VASDEKWWHFKDAVRNCFYAIAPIVVIATVWSIGWAKSIESHINNGNAPASILIDGRIITARPVQPANPQPTGNTDPVADINTGDN